MCNYCRHTHLYTAKGVLPRYNEATEAFIRQVEEKDERERLRRKDTGKVPKLPPFSNEGSTCGCGLYIHPLRRNKDALHISDCEWYIPKKVRP